MGGQLAKAPCSFCCTLRPLVAPFFVPITWTAAGRGVLFYFMRMFGITGVYHRYFAHRAYKTSRWFQFVLAWIGCSAMQKGAA